MKQINVLFICDHFSYNGSLNGGGRFYLNVLPYLDRDKFNVLLCVLRDRDGAERYLEKEGIEVIFLKKGGYNILAVPSIIKIVRTRKIDILHLQGFGASNFGRITKIFTGTPVIIHAHDLHTWYPWYQRLADRFLNRFVDKVIAVSESVKMSCIHKRGFDPQRITVLYNGIDLDNYQTLSREGIFLKKKSMGIPPDKRVVGTITRFHTIKGNEYVIKAAAKVLDLFPETIFILCGDGPLKEELKGLCEKLGIEDNVLFPGFCDDVPAMLSIFDIKVISSLSEGLCLSAMEAMAMKKPIISTNADGIVELLEDMKTALFVPVKNADGIKDKIIMLLKDSQLAHRLGITAYNEIKKYDISVYCSKFEKELVSVYNDG